MSDSCRCARNSAARAPSRTRSPRRHCALSRKGLVAAAERNPWFATLWVREVISEGGVLRQRIAERFGDAARRRLDRTHSRMAEGGQAQPHLEPSLLFVSVFGLTVLPLGGDLYVGEESGGSAPRRDQIARHAVALLMHGIGR